LLDFIVAQTKDKNKGTGEFNEDHPIILPDFAVQITGKKLAVC
jgi:hypothetical protein